MEVKRQLNFEKKSHDYCFIDNDKILSIIFAGNLDLYMILHNGNTIDCENIMMTFDITKENYEIFEIFDLLYHEIITGDVFSDSEYEYLFDYKRSCAYSLLVDRDNNITWISDDGPMELEDKMQFSKVDADTYRLTFTRNDKPLDDGFKSGLGICIRFRNSGSNYSPFNLCFMRMYQRLQNVDPDYHQYHIEELAYTKKRVK